MAVAPAVDPAAYAALQHFYARQMQLLDDERVEEWAATFTEDGVFGTDAFPQPAIGRAAIIAGATQAVARFASEGITRRHWMGMMSADVVGDGLMVRSYALTYQANGDGTADLRFLNICLDRLVPAGDSWLVAERRVSR
jgi:hypothetical protein